MSFPTVLSPWYVVQRLRRDFDAAGDHDIEMVYYTSEEDGSGEPLAFLKDSKRALIFTALQSASRVAVSEGAEVRVLTTKEEAKEFGRD